MGSSDHQMVRLRIAPTALRPRPDLLDRPGLRLGLLACLALSFTAGFAQLPTRDTWIDEVWSMFLSDPTVSMRELTTRRWAYDIHPPVFMLFARALRAVVADRIEAIRVINLLALALAVIYPLLLWHRSAAMRPMLAMFAPVFCSGMFFVHYPAEFRVYFPLILVSALYALSSYRVTVAIVRAWPVDRLDLAVLLVSTALMTTLHVLSAPVVLIHAATLGLLLWRWHGRAAVMALRACWIVIAVTLLGMAAYYLLVEDFSEGMTAGGSWIQPLSTPRALLRAGKWLFMLAPGVVALGLIVAGPFQPRAGAVKTARGSTSLRVSAFLHDGERLWLVSMCIAIAGFVAMMLLANRLTPLMMDRYFAALAGPLAAVLAIAAARQWLRLAPRAQTFAYAAVLVNSLAASLFFAASESRLWNNGMYLSPALAAAVQLNRNCDRPLLHATDNRQRYAVYQDQIGDWVARYLGPRFGVPLQRVDASRPIRVSATCPVAFWAPFLPYPNRPDTIASILAEHRLVLDGARPEQLVLQLFGSSGIVRLKP